MHEHLLHSVTSNPLKSRSHTLLYRSFLFVACLCLLSVLGLQPSSITHAASFTRFSSSAAAVPNDVTVSFKSAQNGLYVSAELNYTGGNYAMLRARASSPGIWETFIIRGGLSCDSIVSIQSAQNGLYVSAELNYTGGNYAMLRARASSPGIWEQFRIICTLSHFAIQSTANHRYVSAELNYTGGNYAMLRARASSPGIWEQFDIDFA